MNPLAVLFTGWQFVLPPVVAASFMASFLLRSRHARLAPWSVVAVWFALFVFLYIETEMNRYLVDEKVAWAIKSLIFMVIAGLPIGAVAWYLFGPYGRRRTAMVSTLTGSLVGIASLPIVHVISVQAAVWFARWVPVG